VGLGFWSNSQGESVKPGGQPAPGLGGEEWVRGTRREPIHGGSCTASMPYTVPRTHSSPPLTVGRRPWIGQRQDPQRQTSIPASRFQTSEQNNSDPTALPLHCAGAFAEGPGNCRGLVGVGSRGPPSHGCDGGAYKGEGALLARHCLACVRTHSRRRLGRAAERDLQRALAAHPHQLSQQNRPRTSPSSGSGSSSGSSSGLFSF